MKPLIYLFLAYSIAKGRWQKRVTKPGSHRLALTNHKKLCSASRPKFSSQSKVSIPQTGTFCGWKQHSETSFRLAAEKKVENWVSPKREEQDEGQEGIHHIVTYTPETANVAPLASAVHAGSAGWADCSVQEYFKWKSTQTSNSDQLNAASLQTAWWAGNSRWRNVWPHPTPTSFVFIRVYWDFC